MISPHRPRISGPFHPQNALSVKKRHLLSKNAACRTRFALVYYPLDMVSWRKRTKGEDRHGQKTRAPPDRAGKAAWRVFAVRARAAADFRAVFVPQRQCGADRRISRDIRPNDPPAVDRPVGIHLPRRPNHPHGRQHRRRAAVSAQQLHGVRNGSRYAVRTGAERALVPRADRPLQRRYLFADRLAAGWAGAVLHRREEGPPAVLRRGGLLCSAAQLHRQHGAAAGAHRTLRKRAGAGGVLRRVQAP